MSRPRLDLLHAWPVSDNLLLLRWQELPHLSSTAERVPVLDAGLLDLVAVASLETISQGQFLSPNQVWASTNLCRGSMSPRAHRRGDLGQQYSSNSITSPLQRREVFLVRENQSGQLTSESQVVAEDDDGQTRVIWGTNVSITESMKKFKEFLLGFQKKYRLRADNVAFDEGEGEEFTYVEMLKSVHPPVVVRLTYC
jgi:hypothetical protein